jgi:DNA replication protein DnaC
MRQVFNQFQHLSLDDFHPYDEDGEEALGTVKSYVGDLDTNRQKGKGLTFMGDPGVGKTFLACMGLKAAYEAGYRIEAVEFSAFVLLMKQQFDLSALLKSADDQVVDRYVSVNNQVRRIRGNVKKPADWVLFDDIGREFPSGSGWSQYELFDLLRFRYNRGLPFFLTTNCGLAELNHIYTEGLVSLLYEATTIVHIGGPDHRDPEWKRAS